MSVTNPTQPQTTTASPTPTTVTTSQPGSDGPLRVSGGVLGILVFLGGVALLIYVFATAIKLFETPPPPLPVPPAPTADPKAAADSGSAIMIIAQSLRDFILRFLLLLLMCIAGSLIASRGIDLFFKACSAPRNP